MPRAFTYGLLALLVATHIIIVGILTKEHSGLQVPGSQNQLFVLPSAILKVSSLEYKGIVSDYLFIKGIVYIGGAMKNEGRRGKFVLSDLQWQEFYNLMDVSTDMDPYFQDPYYLANAFLTWETGMVQETNTLLEKGIHYRTWDWTIPFFAGFNCFYFLQDTEKAAEYLMEASRRPGASPTVASLASKLAFKAKKTESSILFLEEIIKKTDDESMKKLFETRAEAFRAIFSLEKAVDVYRQKFKKSPLNPAELVNKKIIGEIPKDPYGGKFYLDTNGNVRTTSEDQLIPHTQKKQITAVPSPLLMFDVSINNPN